MKKVILTGDRPTGKLHIGHYFGSLKNRVLLQHNYDTYIIIADVQALTDHYDNPSKVRENVREVVLDNLAAGLDPNVAHIFIQSMVPEIAELTVFYSNLVSVSRLYRNPTVKTEAMQKEKLFGKNAEGITYGFLGYPVSQAADITAFGAHLVPVGEDQRPMLEQTREIVHKFNSIYGNVLVEPQAMIDTNARIKGLDGNEKMGKSLGNAIYLADSEEEVRKKVMSAITDKNKIKVDDPANPDICMVYYYHKLFNDNNLSTVCSECKAGKRGCVSCKKELVSYIMKFLKPIQEKRRYYEERPELVDKIIQDGIEAARKKAYTVYCDVRKAMKIDYFDNKNS